MASKQCLGADCDHAKLHKLGPEAVTILVGPEGREENFLVLSDLAKQHSQTIATKLEALAGTEDTRLLMPEYSASNFKIFVSFLYTGKIYTNTNDADEWRLLSELWVLGHALQSTTLRDAVADAMIERRAVAKEFNGDAYVTLMEHLQTKEQTRTGVGKLLVDTTVSCHQHKIYTDARSTKPGSLHFFGEVIMGLDRIRRGTESEKEVSQRAKTGSNCVYHEHSASEICYKKMFSTTQGSLRKPHAAMPRIEDIITEIRVGPEDHVEGFAVRKDLATRHSAFIKKALSQASGWKEAKENVIHFPEESPEAFQVFVTFLETGVIHLGHFKSTKDVVAKEDDLDADKEWNKIAQAWLLGDLLISTLFKDALVDKMVHILQNTAEIPKTMFQKIFARSIGRSGMRDLLVDMAAYHLFTTDLEEQPDDDVYAGYWKQVAIAYRNRITNPSLSAPYDQTNIGCKYHDHNKNSSKTCYKNMFK